MAVKEGALIGGYLLPEKEFKEVIKDSILNNDENLKKIKDIFRRALNNIHIKNIRALYKNIEELESELLKNPTVSLMVITNLNTQEEKMNFYLNKSEKNFIRKGGKISKSKALKNSILNEELNQILSQHLSNFIKEIENYTLTKKEMKEFFEDNIFLSYERKREMGRRAKDSDYSLKQVVYGNNPQYLGQIADAYLNHIGNLHKSLLFNKMANLSEIKLPSSIKKEEGENFFQLLIDSTNSTGWWTGGDLIVLGSNNEILANIQLKTRLSDTNSSVLGKITYEKLEKGLVDLYNLFENDFLKDSEKFANDFYELFKTSGITQEVENIITEEAIQKIKDVII